MAKPRVSVFAMGGTIASAGGGARGVRPSLTADAIVDAVPGLRAVADIEAETFRNVPSPEVSFEDLIALAAAIEARLAAGADGAVVTHGTDTIEESAFVLDRIVASDAPVIVTGAMRNPTMAGADGPANLLGAVRAAIAPQARGLGTLVVMNDEIHAARYVRKTHTMSVATFRSSPAGPLGWIAEDQVRILFGVPSRHPIRLDPGAPDAPVAIVAFGLGDDGRLIEKAVEAGYAGIVMGATGGGHVTAPMADMLVAVSEKIPVVFASRTGGGELLRKTYDFKGSEVDLMSRGLIGAGWLDVVKSRLLLSLLLRSGADRAAIKAAFDAWRETGRETGAGA